MDCPVIEWQMLVKEPEKAAAFYGTVFGWTVDDNNALGYRRVSTGAADERARISDEQRCGRR